MTAKLPEAFAKALKHLPPTDTSAVDYNRNSQMREQQARDKNAETRRTRMGYDSLGFAFKKGEK